MKSRRVLLIELGIAAAVIFLLLWVMVPKFLASQNMNTPDVFPDDYMRASVERLMGVGTFEPIRRSELAQKRGELYISNSHNIEGLQHLRQIDSLVIHSESPTETPVHIKLPALPNLKKLTIIGRMYRTLDVTKVSNLESLETYHCTLSSIDLSRLSKLKKLRLRGYPYRSIDLSHHPELEEADLSHSHPTNKNAVLEEVNLSKNPKLKKLNVRVNQIKELDIRNNPELVELKAGINQLHELDLSRNKNLIDLDVGANKLTHLDVSACTNLESLDIVHNDIHTLDVSNNPKLKRLLCYKCPIDSFDLRNQPDMELLSIYESQVINLTLRYSNTNMLITVTPPYHVLSSQEIVEKLMEEFTKNFPDLNPNESINLRVRNSL